MRGFPNRLSYPEFCTRYTILDASKIKASGITDPKKITEKLCTDFVDKERFREKTNAFEKISHLNSNSETYSNRF